MLLTLTLLGLAILSVWMPSIPIGPTKSVPPWAALFAAAIVSGLVAGILAALAVPALIALLASAWAARSVTSRWARSLFVIVTALLALGLALHLFPGFHNPVLLAKTKLSTDAVPYTLIANFDKASAGLILLALLTPRRSRGEALRPLLLTAAGATIATATIVMAVAMTIGFVRFEPKIPSIALSFLAVNLLFTCVMEEAFFRGLIQEQLTRAVAAQAYLRWLPIVVSTLLFALAHVAGGPTLMALAALGGLGYSLAFARARRVEVAILTHFAVNAVHFFAFTYPSVQG